MAEEMFDQTDNDDFDYSDLEPYEEVAEAEERKVDDEQAKRSKSQVKLAAKVEAMEKQIERDKLVSDFYAKANESEQEFADVLLAGVSDPQKVKKMLELAKAKAATLAGTASTEEVEQSDEADVEAAFSAPPPVGAPEVRDIGKETAEKTRSGDAKSAFMEFLAAPERKGPIDIA